MSQYSHIRVQAIYIRTDVGQNTIPAKNPPEDHYANRCRRQTTTQIRRSTSKQMATQHRCQHTGNSDTQACMLEALAQPCKTHRSGRLSPAPRERPPRPETCQTTTNGKKATIPQHLSQDHNPGRNNPLSALFVTQIYKIMFFIIYGVSMGNSEAF